MNPVDNKKLIFELAAVLNELVIAIAGPMDKLLPIVQRANEVLDKVPPDPENCDHEYDLYEGGNCIHCGANGYDQDPT